VPFRGIQSSYMPNVSMLRAGVLLIEGVRNGAQPESSRREMVVERIARRGEMQCKSGQAMAR